MKICPPPPSTHKSGFVLCVNLDFRGFASSMSRGSNYSCKPTRYSTGTVCQASKTFSLRLSVAERVTSCTELYWVWLLEHAFQGSFAPVLACLSSLLPGTASGVGPQCQTPGQDARRKVTRIEKKETTARSGSSSADARNRLGFACLGEYPADLTFAILAKAL